jgi:hypothetical protein
MLQTTQEEEMDPTLADRAPAKQRAYIPPPVNGGFHRDTFSDPAGRDRRRLSWPCASCGGLTPRDLCTGVTIGRQVLWV